MICPTSYLRQELVNAPPISCRDRKTRQSHDPVIAQGSQGKCACRSFGFDRRYGPGLQGGTSRSDGQRRRKAVGRRDGFQRGFGKALLPSSPPVGGQISAPPFGNLAWLRAFLGALWALSPQGRSSLLPRKPLVAQALLQPMARQNSVCRICGGCMARQNHDMFGKWPISALCRRYCS